MLCQLWTYGSYPLHIPNNADYTVTPNNGKMVTAQGCTPISSVDPQIAQYRASPAPRRTPHDLVYQLAEGTLMPPWQDFEPFIVSGLALGGVYALSGVGLVVLYRATGVLNLAFGAVGAMGALIAWSLITRRGRRAGSAGWPASSSPRR